MRGKAESVLVSLDSKDTVGPFICFTRRDMDSTRSFYHVTERQIGRVVEVVSRMSLNRKLYVHVHTWGWVGMREG